MIQTVFHVLVLSTLLHVQLVFRTINYINQHAFNATSTTVLNAKKQTYVQSAQVILHSLIMNVFNAASLIVRYVSPGIIVELVRL